MAIKLLHHPFCSYCRKVRIVLGERNLRYDAKEVRPWEKTDELLSLNPAGSVPAMLEDSKNRFAGSTAIAEYIDEKYNGEPLIGKTALERAETRRLVDWFDGKFAKEVTSKLVFEKFFKSKYGLGEPDASTLRAGRENIHIHLKYIRYLLEKRQWLAGDRFSLADITAAAHLSVLDYFDEVPWDDHEIPKTWYSIIKSRPSFRSILDDKMAAQPPQANYANLDF